MLRFGFEKYGDPGVFTQIDAPVPTPKADQVLLEVLGFGLNPYDASLRRGEQAEFRHLPWPIVPGTDVVGRVVALGESVTDFALGDLVMNYRPIGGYSEYVTASTGKIAKLPPEMPLASAAALPLVGIAAYTIVHQLLSLEPGATLAVLGASGGVGRLVIQFAHQAGLNVLAFTRSPHPDLLQLGAGVTATYKTAGPSFGQADAAVNAINGGQDDGLATKLVHANGTVVTTAYADPIAPRDDVHYLQLGEPRLAKAEEALPALVQLSPTLPIAAPLDFSLAGVIAGHKRLEQHLPGKLVVMKDLD